jgi:hypothetical protein
MFGKNHEEKEIGGQYENVSGFIIFR